MNDRELHQVRARLQALWQHLPRLFSLVLIHQAERVDVVGFEMPLSGAQKTAIKNKANDIGTRLSALADTLPAPTGKTGVPNAEQVAAAIQDARLSLSYVRTALQKVSALFDGLAHEEDGGATLPGVTFAQDTANTMATVRDSVKATINSLKAQL